MGDEDKEPIDLMERRAEKERKKKGPETMNPWPGARLREKAASIQISDELLGRVKTMVAALTEKVRQAKSLSDISPACHGIALMLLAEHDREAYEKLVRLVREEIEQNP